MTAPRQHPTNSLVLCDLDGTLCDIQHRLHYVKHRPKDWKAFYEGIPHDQVRMPVLALVNHLRDEGKTIVLVSARPINHWAVTVDWLKRHGIAYDALFMRGFNDHRDDAIVKAELLEEITGGDLGSVYLVIDDRPRVIRMWRSKGLPVFDVGAGVEF